MDAVKFLEELKRRSKSNPDYYNEELSIPYINPASLVAQVENWSKENPVKTRQSEFLKLFPKADLDYKGIILIPPCMIDKYMEISCDKRDCVSCRYDYWREEISESKED